jgi:hypothetical protein
VGVSASKQTAVCDGRCHQRCSIMASASLGIAFCSSWQFHPGSTSCMLDEVRVVLTTKHLAPRYLQLQPTGKEWSILHATSTRSCRLNVLYTLSLAIHPASRLTASWLISLS